jgi:hypothetical protein
MIAGKKYHQGCDNGKNTPVTENGKGSPAKPIFFLPICPVNKSFPERYSFFSLVIRVQMGMMNSMLHNK